MLDGLEISLNLSGESQMPTRQQPEMFVIQCFSWHKSLNEGPSKQINKQTNKYPSNVKKAEYKLITKYL